MRARCFLFLVLFCSPCLRSQWIADPEIDSRIQRGIDFIYNLEFENAEKEFGEVVKLRPDHPAGFFFEAMIQWWRILCKYEDESQDKKFYDMLDVVIDMCEKRLDANDNDVAALFFKGGSVGFRGRLRANRGKWLGAANDGLVALPLVRKANKLEPENSDVLLGMGIYNYYAEIVPNSYPIVKPLMIFFPSGDKKKGMEQLILASQHAKYAKIEASYFLMQNYFQYEKEYPKALELARKLNQKYPRNPLFHRYLGRTLVSLGYIAEANEVFLEIAKRFNENQLGYDAYDGREAYYYLGRYEFIGNRSESALKHFFKCDELSRKLDKEGTSGFMSLANLTIGMIYDAQKKRDLAVQQYRKVLTMKEYENSRRDAEKFLLNPFVRN